MNLRQIRAFSELMKTGSVSQTARNLNRTQPSISSAISGLEENLGIQLFERKSGRLYPVREAHYLFEECSEILERVEKINQNMQRIKSLKSGELLIASMPGPSVFTVPQIIANYAKNHPDIQTTLISRSSDVIIQLISAQQYDIGITDNPPKNLIDNNLFSSEVIRYACLCAIPAGNPLSREKIISFDKLVTQPLALLNDNHPVSIQLMQNLKHIELKPNTIFYSQYFMPLLSYVEKGLACSIIDPVTAKSYALYNQTSSQNIVFRPLAKDIFFELALLRPTQRPPSLIAEDFSQTLTKYFKDLASL